MSGTPEDPIVVSDGVSDNGDGDNVSESYYIRVPGSNEPRKYGLDFYDGRLTPPTSWLNHDPRKYQSDSPVLDKSKDSPPTTYTSCWLQVVGGLIKPVK